MELLLAYIGQEKYIGEGWQYRVYAIDHNRVYKRRNSLLLITRHTIYSFRRSGPLYAVPGHVFEMLTDTLNVRNLAHTIPTNALHLFGNPTFHPNGDYEQDFLSIGSHLFSNMSAASERASIDQLVLFTEMLWSYGFCEKTFFFWRNYGLNKKHQFVVSDLGEITSSLRNAEKHVRSNRWTKACEASPLSVCGKEYFKEKLRTQLTPERLRSLWKTKSMAR